MVIYGTLCEGSIAIQQGVEYDIIEIPARKRNLDFINYEDIVNALKEAVKNGFGRVD